jgi:serine/threonine protein kinase
MTVGTTQALLELLAKSELLSPEQLTECQETALLAEDVRAFVRILIEKGLITRWQAAQLLAGRSSFFLGKYKLIELLGRGGMGGVFVAEHTTMNRRVALKIISKELGRDPASLERFLIEARAGAALDHPNIVHSYSVDNEGDRYYMVMEFVEGKDLQRMVEDDGPLDFERAVDYMRQAADGLAHAHSRKMIHCDIKPANLIVNQQGVVKILDMGMARLMGHDDESNGHDDKANGHDDRVLGTVDYLAPEQALGSPDLDHRVDIYSLGCTFYFLLTGQPPFPEGTLAQRIVKHQTQEPRSILELRPTTPRDLVKLCQKMMAKDPEKRIQSAAEISQWLAAWQPPKQKLVRAVPLEEEAEKPADALESLAAAVAVAEHPSLSDATGTPLESSKGLRFTPRQQLLLYSGITGGVVLLLLVVLIIVLVSREGDKSSARRTRSKNVAAEQNGENGDFALPKLPPPDLNFDPSKVPAAAPEQTPPPPPDAKAAKPTEKPAAKPTPKPAAKPAEKPATKPAEKAMSKPVEKPAEKPAAKSQTAKPAEKPAPKPAAAPKKDPLSGLPKVVDLPVLGTDGGDKPFVIGKVFTAPDSGWRLWLYGGDNALRSTRQMLQQFVLEEKEETDPAKATWGVKLEEKSIDGSAKHSEVARFWREGDSLKFQWAQGAEADSANYLRNCVLEVRADGKSATLPLVKPKVVEPLAIDLYKGVARLSIPAEFVPDPSKLRVQITKVEGRQGYTLEPSEPAEPKTPILLSYVRKDRDGNEPEKVEFQIRCNARATGLGLELNGNLTTTQAKGPRVKVAMVFKQYSLDGIEQDKTALRSERSGKESKLKTMKPGEDRSPVLNRIRELDRGLWYLEFFEAVHTKTKIHFAIYMEAGEHKTILAKTQ